MEHIVKKSFLNYNRNGTVSEDTKENIYVSTISNMSDTAYDHNDRLCHDSQQKRDIEP